MNQVTLGPLADFNSAIPWGLWVAIYTWLIGISAGSFFLVSLGNAMNNAPLKKIRPLGTALSIAAISVGLLSILIDLGHMERFYKLFSSPSPTSVMAWMSWSYGIYFLILGVPFVWSKKDFPKIFWVFSAIFALAIVLAESLLFALPPGKHWHSAVFPVHFLTSSLVSGAAALIFAIGILRIKGEKTELPEGLSKIALFIIVVNLLVEIADAVFIGSLDAKDSLILLLGNLVAIILFSMRNPVSKTIAGATALVNMLLSKYFTLISAQTVEPFNGFGKAYIEPRLQFAYAPSVFEYIISVLLVGAVAVLFYILYKIFPLIKGE